MIGQEQEEEMTTAISSNNQHHTYPLDEDSDMGSSFDDAEDQQMEYWLQRCSICFDAPLDFCLEYCRDQYCMDCFERYVTEVVMSSWGLSVTKLKCPVCQEHIPQDEWSQFVPKSVVDHYNRFNQPYRSFTRCCPHCEKEAKPCDHTLNKLDDITYMRRIHDMVASLALQDCNGYDKENDYHHHQELHESLKSLLPLLEGDCPSSTLLDVYRYTMNLLVNYGKYHGTFVNKSTLSSPYYAISYMFTLLDLGPEIWKQLQFLHISYFPNTTCESCLTEFCLQCGYTIHEKLTCEENMKHLVESAPSKDHDTVVTVQWHLKNSRRCPNCSIMINRDEGCNKVDCSLCGFCFCWACRSPWSEKCGFYHCVMTEGTEDNDISNNKLMIEEVKTELGVPNISSIQARLFSNPETLD
ncbi:uncharacterized protein BX664DRAFT_353690 [Halteromyces radiatus]|uniref:uncharacterized protein n=1 Tax=Halteromyces radiatus TaxID=101107 RepID=UPI00221FB194|nr:uncharacterized protein BX664DRAFT_353690 [Halteromyces radiatus]KAI8077856.1 hypothetical protein BX664DRAFT_353690 [Halteromyces radiatus]